MMGLGANTRVAVTVEGLPSAYFGQLDADELELVQEVGGRGDTACLTLVDTDSDTLLAYAIFGRDEGGMIAIYAARSWLKGFGAMAIKNLFGASRIFGAPMRVHTERLNAYAKMLGAESFTSVLDGDGLPQGVFYG